MKERRSAPRITRYAIPLLTDTVFSLLLEKLAGHHGTSDSYTIFGIPVLLCWQLMRVSVMIGIPRDP
jgi:hypothetical protein